MEPVTKWKRWNDLERRWEHNHIEDGHIPYGQESPQPRFPAQRSWKGARWLKLCCYLNERGQICDDTGQPLVGSKR